MYDWDWDETSECDPEGPDLWSRPPEERIAVIAAGQKGLICWDQLRDAGLEPKAIRHRVATRRLHVVHYKVYSVGRDCLTQDERFMAAVLAEGLDSRRAIKRQQRFGE
jgi:predicted NAD/FAD-dependent oxidoreductase